MRAPTTKWKHYRSPTRSASVFVIRQTLRARSLISARVPPAGRRPKYTFAQLAVRRNRAFRANCCLKPFGLARRRRPKKVKLRVGARKK